MEPSIEDIIRGIVAESNGEMSCAIAEISKRLGYIEAKLKPYEDAAPVNYNGPQFNHTVNTRGRPKIEFVDANANKAYVFECNFPDAHEPSIKIGVEGFQNLAVRLTRTQVQDLLEIFRDFAHYGSLDPEGKGRKRRGIGRPK